MAFWDFVNEYIFGVKKPTETESTRVLEMPENADQAIITFAKFCKSICDYEVGPYGNNSYRLKYLFATIFVSGNREKGEGEIKLYLSQEIPLTPEFLAKNFRVCSH